MNVMTTHAVFDGGLILAIATPCLLLTYAQPPLSGVDILEAMKAIQQAQFLYGFWSFLKPGKAIRERGHPPDHDTLFNL